MAARPPQNGGDGGSDAIVFGIAALDGELDRADVTFPTDTETLRERLGDSEIAVDGSGHTVRFGEVLETVEHRRFDSQRELLNTLHPVFEERRADAGTGLFARLRSLVPF